MGQLILKNIVLSPSSGEDVKFCIEKSFAHTYALKFTITKRIKGIVFLKHNHFTLAYVLKHTILQIFIFRFQGTVFFSLPLGESGGRGQKIEFFKTFTVFMFMI